MSLRLSIVCGGLFMVAAIAAAGATLADAPHRAMRNLRERLTACSLPGLQCSPPGVFLHQRTIGASADAAFGLPDPTMLVSSTWIDLSGGTAELKIPATGDRFFAIQFIDARDDTVAIAQPRSIGRNGGALLLTGPTGAPGGTDVVHVTSDWVWVVARFAVTDEADVPAVHELQDALRVSRR